MKTEFKEPNKLFEPANYNDVRYTIEIQVCPNGNKFIVREGSQKTFTFQEVVGALEMMKFSVIEAQSNRNREYAKKKIK